MSRNILKKFVIKSTISIWLDVSKSKIDVFLLWNDWDLSLQIGNTKEWILKFIKSLEENKLNKEVPLIIESTWDYNTLACILFSENGFNIIEINPIITKNYVKHTIRWTKTDKTDAKALANIWILNKENLFKFSKDKSFIEVSKKISLVSGLEKELQSLKRMLRSFHEVNNVLEISISPAVKKLQETITELENNVKTLQKEIEESNLKKSDKNKVEIIASIKGISKYMAMVFYVSFCYKDFVSKESMYAFIWYDPKLKDSWAYSGKASISKRWDPYIRKKLYQAWFCWKKHCELFKNIYERAKEKGKHHFVWVISVVKKMVHIMYSLLKNNTMFQADFALK